MSQDKIQDAIDKEKELLEEYFSYLKSVVDTNSNRDERYSQRKNKRDRIRRELNNQLDSIGATQSHYKDLVLDYMALWDIKSELIYDIRTKGVSVMYKNGANQYGWKKNDSVSELNKVNGQMLRILNDLSLKPVDLEEDDEDDFQL